MKLFMPWKNIFDGVHEDGETTFSLLDLNKRLWFEKDNKVTSLDLIFPLNPES